MTQAVFTTLMRDIGGDHITGFFLVLARIAPLFVLAPLFSSKMVPRQVRVIIAVGIATGLTGIAMQGQSIPTDPLAVTGLMIVQLLVGGAFALAIAAVFAAVEAGGALIDVVAGFSYGQLIDPVDGVQGGVMSNLYGMVGLSLFIAIGGDAWVLRGLAKTFSLVPLTKAPQIGSLAGGAVSASGSVLLSAVEVAAPALLVLLITDIAFGMVSRVVPNLNIFAVGFPTKIGMALLVVGVSLPFVGTYLSDAMGNAVGTFLHSLNVA